MFAAPVDFRRHFGSQVPSASRPAVRCLVNPLLTPRSIEDAWQLLITDHPVMLPTTVHNAAVALARRDGRMVVEMYPRIHVADGRSVIGYASSAGGVKGWNIHVGAVLKPATKHDAFAPGVDVTAQIVREAGGVEDMRITDVLRADGRVSRIATYSAYSAVRRDEVYVCLAEVGEDGKTFTRLGPISDSVVMRNVVLVPRTINGQYVALVRANGTNPEALGDEFAEIRIARSNSLCGGWAIDDNPIMRTGFGPSPFQHKIGPGAQLHTLKDGRLLSIFHGVRTTMADNPYCLGVAVHSADMTSVRMCSLPLLMPTQMDCLLGASAYEHVRHVVFTCGLVCVPPEWGGDGNDLLVYYGGNDTVVNVFWTRTDVLLDRLDRYEIDPLTGEYLYTLP